MHHKNTVLNEKFKYLLFKNTHFLKKFNIIAVISAIRNKTLNSVNLSHRKVKHPEARQFYTEHYCSNIRILLVTFKICENIFNIFLSYFHAFGNYDLHLKALSDTNIALKPLNCDMALRV